MDLEAEVEIAAVEGDFVERAQRIANAIRKSGIQVAFYHAGLDEQITARVASFHPTPIQINVDHAGEMDADIFNGRIHLFQNGVERTRFSNAPSEWIPPASDIETRLQMSEPITREAMGLQSAASVSATFGNLNKVASSGYLRALSEIMKRFSKHFHLFAGAGDVKAIRPHLHSQGVLPRVRFLGNLGDVAPLFNVIDVYLAPFPKPSCRSILEAMGAGKPVVALRFPPDSSANAAAELVGIRDLTAPGEADYVEIIDRLLRNPGVREQLGQAVRDRFRGEFRPARMGERYTQFLDNF
jgi:glycosyltransferase involved in cell wall biosynthesis